jgi:hypothetical protein
VPFFAGKGALTAKTANIAEYKEHKPLSNENKS